MDNQSKFQNSKEIIAYLVEKFPKSFFLEGKVKPLKVGIFHDIVECLNNEKEQLISNKQLRLALRLYTSSWRYLEAMKEGAMRIDLAGNENELIDHVQAELAGARLAESKALVKKSKPVKTYKKPPTTEKFTKSSSQADTKKPTANKKPQKNKSHPAQENQTRNKVVSVESLALLSVGQAVKIVVSKNVHNAIVVEIAKDSVKVRLSSGLEVMARREHIVV